MIEFSPPAGHEEVLDIIKLQRCDGVDDISLARVVDLTIVALLPG
jgi:hypothetical protein